MQEELLVEKVYEQARADESIWKQTKALGISRQKSLHLMALGAGVAIAGLPRIRFEQPVGAGEVLVKPTPPELFYN